ncbi:MAG: type II secretion system protein [Verrucomicrobiota bacterium]
MMTRRRETQRDGFTILEMLISLFLIMLILSVAIYSIGSMSKERRLMHPATELRSFAKKALKSSVAEQRSYSIYFLPGAFVLEETYPVETEEEEEVDLGGTVLGGDDEEADRPSIEEMVVSLRHDLAEDVVLEVRRWNGTEWIIGEEEIPQEWEFTPSGLCEPLSVRFSIGEDYVELDFNPLTAGVEEERSYIQ